MVPARFSLRTAVRTVLAWGETSQNKQLVREAERVLRDSSGASRETEGSHCQTPPESLLPEAVRAAQRSLGLNPTISQVAAAIAVIRGMVAELPTGEGKTLAVAMAAACLASANSVHVATANDYLARRDSDWMTRLYAELGLTCCAVTPALGRDARLQAYRCDITYGTIQEFGFDALRDGLRSPGDSPLVLTRQALLVDEADSLLIDEARFPLVLSAASRHHEDLAAVTLFVESLGADDVSVDVRSNRAWLTDSGLARLISEFETHGSDGLDPDLYRRVLLALKARTLYREGKHYVVRDGRVEVVDEYTGRALRRRRWSDGLQQAIEAKERVRQTERRVPCAQITTRSFARLYSHVGGLSATAVEVDWELLNDFGLSVVRLDAANRPQRIDRPDQIFSTAREKLDAVVRETAREHGRRRPVLIGCSSVVTAERLSAELKLQGVRHRLLTAMNDAEEAEVIAAAGEVGAVTVATQLAGRGVDIQLGGAAGRSAATVRALGGLLVIGAERFESSRHERQLRGRAGRQGDPGESVFYVSAEDTLLAPWVGTGGSIESVLSVAQQNLAFRNRSVRADVVAFDEVYERQRQTAQRMRRTLADGGNGGLDAFDAAWSAHLLQLRSLLDVVNFSAWGGDSPLSAWERGAYELFRDFASASVSETRYDEQSAQMPDGTRDLGPRAPAFPYLATADAGVRPALSSYRSTWGAATLLDVVITADADGVGAEAGNTDPQSHNC